MALDYLFFVVVMVIAAVGVWKWWQIVNRPQVELLTHPTPFGLVDVLVFFAGWVLAPGLALAGLISLWGQTDATELSAAQNNIVLGIGTFAQLIASVILVCWLLRRYGSINQVFGVDANKWFEHVKLAGIVFAMVVPALLALQWLLALLVPYEHSTIDQLREDFSLSTFIVTWFAAVVVAPIGEELFFRGVLQGWLQRVTFDASPIGGAMTDIFGGWPQSTESPESLSSLDAESNADDVSGAAELAPVQTPGFDSDNPYVSPGSNLASRKASQQSAHFVGNRFVWWFPIVVSAGMFAAVHYGQGLAPVALFLFGLALGFLYRQTGSIVPCIVLHFFLNFFSMFWLSLDLALK